MPIYIFKCESCNGSIEELMKYEIRDTFANDNVCECGGDLKVATTTPAKTPGLWGDQTGTYGASGYYSKSLGAYCQSKSAEEKIMASRGFIREADLPKDIWEKNASDYREKSAKADSIADEYSKAIKVMPKEKAIAEVFNTERCLSGELDTIYN